MARSALLFFGGVTTFASSFVGVLISVSSVRIMVPAAVNLTANMDEDELDRINYLTTSGEEDDDDGDDYASSSDDDEYYELDDSETSGLPGTDDSFTTSDSDGDDSSLQSITEEEEEESATDEERPRRRGTLPLTTAHNKSLTKTNAVADIAFAATVMSRRTQSSPSIEAAPPETTAGETGTKTKPKRKRRYKKKKKKKKKRREEGKPLTPSSESADGTTTQSSALLAKAQKKKKNRKKKKKKKNDESRPNHQQPHDSQGLPLSEQQQPVSSPIDPPGTNLDDLERQESLLGAVHQHKKTNSTKLRTIFPNEESQHHDEEQPRTKTALDDSKKRHRHDKEKERTQQASNNRSGAGILWGNCDNDDADHETTLPVRDLHRPDDEDDDKNNTNNDSNNNNNNGTQSMSSRPPPKQRSQPWKLYILFAAVGIALVVAIIMLILVLVTENGSNSNESRQSNVAPPPPPSPVGLLTPSPVAAQQPNTSPVLPPTNQQPTTPAPIGVQMTPDQNQSFVTRPELLAWIASNSADMGAAILQTQTPQHKAYLWLQNNDTLFFASSNNNNNNNSTTTITETQRRRQLQRYRLMAFYYGTHGDMDWLERGQWGDPNISECNWKSPSNNNNNGPPTANIECASLSIQDKDDLVIERLELIRNNVTGTLVPEVGELTHLQVLTIDNTQDAAQGLVGGQLTGRVPTTLVNLRQLRRIKLVGNAWTQEPLPNDLFNNWPLITHVNLGRNGIPGPIPTSIGAIMDTIVQLNLGGNALTGPIPTELGSSSSSPLYLLVLANNQLQGFIPTQLAKLAALRTLQVSGNQLTGPFPTIVGHSLTQLRAHLDVSNNQLTGSLAFSVFANLTQLQALSLQQNAFTGPIPNLTPMMQLRRFNLSGNAFTGQVPTTVCARLLQTESGGVGIVDCNDNTNDTTDPGCDSTRLVCCECCTCASVPIA